MSESLDELLRMKQFSKENLTALDSYKYDHRKKEWLVSRILAEHIIGEKNIRIVYDEYNKPSLHGSNLHISLSHSHDLLGFIVDEAATGIDIEIIKPKIFNIKHKFMSKMELLSLQEENNAEQLTVYWCAKESLYKLYGKKELEFKENLPIEPFKYEEKGIIKGWIKNSVMNTCFNLPYEQLNLGKERYMLTYIIAKD